MQKEQLYISGQLVDIIPNTINRNLQINDLGSAEDRQSNYSNTVKLPMTATNRRVFEFLGVSGNNSRAPYKQLHCRYVVDGIPLIVNGYAEVKASSEYYEVVLFDGVIDLAERIKGKTLSDLNYSDLNHYLSAQTYTDSFSNTEGYIYALGDFGIWGGGIKVERQIPSIYTHTIFKKIFDEAGINYYGDFFSTNSDYLTEVITPPLGYEVEDVEITTTLMGSYDTDAVYHLQDSQDYIFEADEIFGFDTTFSHPSITFGTNGTIIFNQSESIQLDVDLNYLSTDGYNSFQVIFNGSVIKSHVFTDTENSAIINLNLSVSDGDTLYFKVNGSDTGYGQQGSPDGNNSVDGNYRVQYNANATVSFSQTTGGFYINFNQMMGDMDQIDFIKDILQRYGLVLKPVRGSNDYEFIQFEQLLNDRAGADDWSDKLIGITKESYGVKYAKENNATYKYHDDIEIPTHDGVLTVDNENADADKNFFSSPYQIPITNNSYRFKPLYLHQAWEEKEVDGSTVIQPKEAKPKHFRVEHKNTSLTAAYFNDSNAVSFTGDVPYLGLENMSMQYFLNVYYKAYGLAINTYKEVDVDLNLNEVDIYNLDFFKLKYFKQSGKFYYLNKVQYKAGNKNSGGQLIELNAFSVNESPTTLGTYTYSLQYGQTRAVDERYFTTSTTPAYYDPENDAPYKIKFITDNPFGIKMYQAGVEITAGTEILFNDLDITIEDQLTTQDAHTGTWTYQIADSGSQRYGDAEGTFTVNVPAYQNQAPTANAGNDATVNIDTSSGVSIYTHNLNGSGSDATGSITGYLWSIESKPAFSDATLLNRATQNATLRIPNNQDNVGSYTIQLEVTDEFGLTGTDTVTITVNQTFGGGNGGLEPA